MVECFFLMITEERKYRAYTFNIGGFALITPLGKIILEPSMLTNQIWIIPPLVYIIFCILLALVGLWSIAFGRDILDE